jgi:hypothetical protein
MMGNRAAHDCGVFFELVCAVRRFEEAAAKDKQRAQEEKEAYEQSDNCKAWKNGGEAKANEEPDSKKRKKDPNAPKGASTAYILYSVDEGVNAKLKEANPDMKMCDISKLKGVQWKALSEEEKKP